MKRLIIAIIVFLGSSSAFANQIYRWSAIGTAEPLPMTLEMEFTDSVVASGYFNFTSQYCATGGMLCPYTGSRDLVNFFFKTPSGGPISYHAPIGNTITHSPTEISLEIYFLTNGRIAGSIYGQNYESGVRLNSIGDIFHLTSYGNDAGNPGCFASQACRDNATGVIAAIPEPSTILLFASTILALLFASRRNSRV